MAMVIEFHIPKNFQKPSRHAPSPEKMYEPLPTEVTFTNTILKLFGRLMTLLPACPTAREVAPVLTVEKTSTCKEATNGPSRSAYSPRPIAFGASDDAGCSR